MQWSHHGCIPSNSTLKKHQNKIQRHKVFFLLSLKSSMRDLQWATYYMCYMISLVFILVNLYNSMIGINIPLLNIIQSLDSII